MAQPELYFFQKDGRAKVGLEMKSLKDIDPSIVNAKLQSGMKIKPRIEFTHKYRGKVILIDHQEKERKAQEEKLRKMIEVKREVIPSLKMLKQQKEKTRNTNTNSTSSIGEDHKRTS